MSELSRVDSPTLLDFSSRVAPKCANLESSFAGCANHKASSSQVGGCLSTYRVESDRELARVKPIFSLFESSFTNELTLRVRSLTRLDSIRSLNTGKDDPHPGRS